MARFSTNLGKAADNAERLQKALAGLSEAGGGGNGGSGGGGELPPPVTTAPEGSAARSPSVVNFFTTLEGTSGGGSGGGEIKFKPREPGIPQVLLALAELKRFQSLGLILRSGGGG